MKIEYLYSVCKTMNNIANQLGDEDLNVWKESKILNYMYSYSYYLLTLQATFSIKNVQLL